MNQRRAYWERLANFGARWMLVLFIASTAFMFMQQRGQDFVAFYLAAKQTWVGANPYDYSLTLPLMEQTIVAGGNAPFYYPLWSLFPLFPLTVFPFWSARLIWLFVNILLGAFSLWLLGSMMKLRTAPWVRDMTWLLAFIILGWLTLRNDQVAIIILCDLVLTLWALTQGHEKIAAAGLALLAAKPNITFLALAVLATWLWFNNRKIFWMSLLMGVALLAVSFLVMPWFWDPILAGRLPNGLTVGLNGAGDDGRRLNTTLLDFLRYSLGIDEPIAFAVAILGWLVSLWLLWRWRHDVFFLLVLSTTVVFIISPYAMQYDFPLLALPLFWVMRAYPRVARCAQAAVILGIGLMLVVVFRESLVSDGLWMPIIMTDLLILTAPPVVQNRYIFEIGNG